MPRGPGPTDARPAARLTVLSGPSGVGKDSVIELIRARSPWVWLSVSCTTRPPRHYEVGWNEGALQDIAAGWAHEVDRAPQNARFDWNNGQVSVTQESQDGVQKAEYDPGG